MKLNEIYTESDVMHLINDTVRLLRSNVIKEITAYDGNIHFVLNRMEKEAYLKIPISTFKDMEKTQQLVLDAITLTQEERIYILEQKIQELLESK